MTRIVSVVALCAALCYVGYSPACGPEKPTVKHMTETMIRVHRGEKSPYAFLEKEATAKEPNWDEFAKHLKTVKDMSKMNGEFVRDEKHERNQKAPSNYADAVKNLAAALEKKDAKLASESFASLQKSCIACHSYGGLAIGNSEKGLRKEK
jgi:cytochrome c556